MYVVVHRIFVFLNMSVTIILKSIRKRTSQEASCTKHDFNLQIYSKAYRSRNVQYENMELVTHLLNLLEIIKYTVAKKKNTNDDIRDDLIYDLK